MALLHSSASIIVGAFVLPDIKSGMTEASATRKLSTPNKFVKSSTMAGNLCISPSEHRSKNYIASVAELASNNHVWANVFAHDDLIMSVLTEFILSMFRG